VHGVVAVVDDARVPRAEVRGAAAARARTVSLVSMVVVMGC